MRILLGKAIAPSYVAYTPVAIFVVTNALPSNPLLSFVTLIIFCTLPGYSLVNVFRLRLETGFENLFLSVLLSIFTLSIIFTAISFTAYYLGFHHIFKRGPTFMIGFLLIIVCSRNLDRSGQSKALIWAMQRMLKNISPQIGIVTTCLVLLPFVSFIAVSQLNRGGSSVPSVIFLCLCIVILLMLFSSRVSSGTAPIHYIFLYSVIFAILIQTAFRGDGGFWGYDVNAEYAAANRTLFDGHWIPTSTENAYQSMLSITVLPVVLSLLSKLSLGIIFKLFYVMVAALLPVAIYSILIKYVRKSIAMSVICVEIVGSISFIESMSALCRQVIGTAFFVGILVAIFTQEWSRNKRFSVIVTLAFGLSFSHYSSAYFACTIFLAASAIIFLSKFTKSWNKRDYKPIITIPLALGILTVTLLWNAGINHTIQESSGVASAVTRLGVDLLPDKTQNFVQRWLAGVSVTAKISSEEYKNRVLSQVKNEYPSEKIRESARAYTISLPDYPKATPPLGRFIPTALGLLYIAFNTFFQILILIFCYVFFGGRKRKFGRQEVEISNNIGNFQGIRIDLTAVALIGLLLAILIRSSNSISIFYNPERAAFQLSLIFSLPIAIILEGFFTRYSAKERMLWWILPFSGFLFIQNNSGLHEYLSGTSDARISNAVAPSMQFVISTEERAASTWLSNTLPPGSILQADSYALLVFAQSGQIPASSQIPQIAPFGLITNSYVYLSTPNLKSGIAVCPGLINNSYASFTLPIDYLNNNLALVYNSGGTRVYR